MLQCNKLRKEMKNIFRIFPLRMAILSSSKENNSKANKTATGKNKIQAKPISYHGNEIENCLYFMNFL